MCATRPAEAARPRPLPETIQMRVPQTAYRIPGRSIGTWTSTDGPNKGQRRGRLEPATKCKRCTIVPRVHRFLSVFHQRLLENRPSIDRLDQEKLEVRMD